MEGESFTDLGRAKPEYKYSAACGLSQQTQEQNSAGAEAERSPYFAAGFWASYRDGTRDKIR